MVEKSGVEKFMVENSGVEMSFNRFFDTFVAFSEYIEFMEHL